VLGGGAGGAAGAGGRGRRAWRVGEGWAPGAGGAGVLQSPQFKFEKKCIPKQGEVMPPQPQNEMDQRAGGMQFE